MEIGFLFLWVTVAVALLVWLFIDAKRRYDSWGVAFLWILGILGMLIVFLPLYFIVRPRSPRKGKTVACPSCGRYSRSGSRFCRFCGADLAQPKEQA